jgi:undecaprenyl-diphosphatase
VDSTVEQWINQPAGSHRALDTVMKGLAGGAEVAFIAFVVLWFLYGWWAGRRPDRFGAITALLAAGGALGINQVITSLWQRPRPFVAHSSVHVLLSHSSDASFPSDHAAAAFAIAAVVVALRARIGVVALVAAVAVAYARVYVGLHYPGDVAAGAVIGIAVAAVALWPLRVIPERITDVVDAILVRVRLSRAATRA